MKKGWLWAAAITAVIGLGAGTAGGYAIHGDEERVETLPANLSVGGLSVGGQTADEALANVRSRIQALETTAVVMNGNPTNPPTLTSPSADSDTANLPATNPSQSSLAALSFSATPPSSSSSPAPTFEQLGMSVDASEAIAMLEAYRDATWRQRAAMQKSTMKSEYDVKVAWNEAAFEREAAAAWGAIASSEGHDASRTINDRDEVVYTAETNGTALDTHALMATIIKLAPASLAPEAVDAASAGLQALGAELPVVQVPPKVTEASLKEEGINRKIAEFTTSFSTSAEGRSYNVTMTAKALDGTLLMPGDVFDYGQIVAKTEQEYGYKEAPVIVNGKLTPGIGGGICQVSSTLYNAVIRTEGIDIVERRNHSLPVHYLPIGLDATFADGYINFRFRNSTGKQLLIKTEVKNKELTVKLFGTMDEHVSYDIETVQKQVIAPKTVYVADNQVELGKSQVKQSGETGYVIDSYRVKLIDGKFAERQKLATSNYKSQNEIVAVNAADPRMAPAGADDNKPAPPSEEGPVEPL